VSRARTAGAVVGGLAGLLAGAPLAGASMGAEIGGALGGTAAKARPAVRNRPVRRLPPRGAGHNPAIAAGLLVALAVLLTDPP
jgi:hypothetical protein